MSKGIPKLILLQIGFVELDKNYKTDNRLYNSSLAKYLKEQKKSKTLFDNNYFTLDAIRDSLRVIFVNNWGTALHSNYRKNGDYVYEAPNPGPVEVQQSSYAGWELDKNRVQILLKLKDLCTKNNIKLIVFTAPLSYEHYKIAVSHPDHPIFLKKLKETYQEFWNFHTESIKSYSSYKEFSNSTHMTHDFSETLLRRMLGGEFENIGKFIK